MQFEYYVLNHDCNAKKVYMFNVFCNSRVQENAEKEVKKYCRNPKGYKIKKFDGEELTGFEAFCYEIRSIIRWQEWSRVQYEISVGEPFCDDLGKLEKWDCAGQCEPNIPMICREIIYQYKNSKKTN